MRLKSDNMEIRMNYEADVLIKEPFDSLKNRYQCNLQPMKGSEPVFDYVNLLHYKCHEINQNRGESYIDSPDWIKNKKQHKFHKKKITNVFNTPEQSH